MTFSDVNRVCVVDPNSLDGATYTNGFATRLIDKIFPITMPYFPPAHKFKVFREEFLVDPENGDFDSIGFLYLLTPEGHKIELNRYFKEEDGQMVQIEKAEFDERKAKRVNAK